VQGYTAEEKEQAYTRARELCHPAPEAPLSFQILQGLWAFHLLRADYETASELMTEGLALVRHLPHPTPPLVARVALGSTRFFLGDLPGAQEYLTPGNASEARQHLGPAPMVPDVVAQGLVYRAMVGWLSGHPGTALQSIREALALAQELSQPLTQVFVLTWATWLVAGAVLPALQGLLAAAYCKAGQIDAGLAVIRAALSQGEQHRAPCYWTAELHRLKGELALMGQTGPESYLETAESCFQHALEVARQQHARWLELRAAVSLSQLWQQHGRRDAARHLLTEICGHFAAGDEVPDLQTARDLCAALE
jgi:tetratricopeptide (TPR) repeat protein